MTIAPTTRYRQQLKCLSVLLQFPDAELIETVAGARRQVAELFEGHSAAIGDVVAYLAETPLLDLQEAYSETFDLNPGNSLNLTYHKFGDKKERGAAMARFAETYANAGYAPATGELPDFLPLVLEFLSVAENGCADWMRTEYADALGTLESRLTEAGSPYGTVLRIVSGILNTMASKS